MAVRIGGQAVIERRNDEEYGSLCSIRAKAQWQDRDESRRMRKLRRETSIISITSFSRNGKISWNLW